MGRITINGTITQFSAKITAPVALWEVKGSRAKGKSLEADRINRHLDNIRDQINKHYQFISDHETYVTAEKVRNAYLGLGKRYKTLMETFDAYIVALKQRIGVDRSKTTFLGYCATSKHLRSFLQDKYHVSDIALVELEACFIELFHVYLQAGCNLSAHAGIWDVLSKWSRQLSTTAQCCAITLLPIPISASAPERTFLTADELQRLRTTPLREGLNHVRDLFLFSCFTGICHAICGL